MPSMKPFPSTVFMPRQHGEVDLARTLKADLLGVPQTLFWSPLPTTYAEVAMMVSADASMRAAAAPAGPHRR